VLSNQRRSRTRWERLLGRVRLLDAGETPLADLAPPDHAADMRVALGKLTDTERDILLMTVWEGLTHAEVGQVLGMSENAISIRAHRARRKLRAAYEQEIGAGDPGTDDVASKHPRGGETE
jgi:RNA polymerase sigma-70 factor (ECF subfamily)